MSTKKAEESVVRAATRLQALCFPNRARLAVGYRPTFYSVFACKKQGLFFALETDIARNRNPLLALRLKKTVEVRR